MFGTRSATQKFPKFRSRAGTGFSMDQLRLVELNVSFVNQRATWLHAECTHSFNLRVFGGVCAFCDFFFAEMEDVKEQRVCIVLFQTWQECGKNSKNA